jgi:hypothetical protein
MQKTNILEQFSTLDRKNTFSTFSKVLPYFEPSRET